MHIKYTESPLSRTLYDTECYIKMYQRVIMAVSR